MDSNRSVCVECGDTRDEDDMIGCENCHSTFMCYDCVSGSDQKMRLTDFRLHCEYPRAREAVAFKESIIRGSPVTEVKGWYEQKMPPLKEYMKEVPVYYCCVCTSSDPPVVTNAELIDFMVKKSGFATVGEAQKACRVSVVTAEIERERQAQKTKVADKQAAAAAASSSADSPVSSGEKRKEASS